jgi:hypothetical protein
MSFFNHTKSTLASQKKRKVVSDSTTVIPYNDKTIFSAFWPNGYENNESYISEDQVGIDDRKDLPPANRHMYCVTCFCCDRIIYNERKNHYKNPVDHVKRCVGAVELRSKLDDLHVEVESKPYYR